MPNNFLVSSRVSFIRCQTEGQCSLFSLNLRPFPNRTVSTLIYSNDLHSALSRRPVEDQVVQLLLESSGMWR